MRPHSAIIVPQSEYFLSLFSYIISKFFVIFHVTLQNIVKSIIVVFSLKRVDIHG